MHLLHLLHYYISYIKKIIAISAFENMCGSGHLGLYEHMSEMCEQRLLRVWRLHPVRVLSVLVLSAKIA